jgi:hypothetical protein
MLGKNVLVIFVISFFALLLGNDVSLAQEAKLGDVVAQQSNETFPVKVPETSESKKKENLLMDTTINMK